MKEIIKIVGSCCSCIAFINTRRKIEGKSFIYQYFLLYPIYFPVSGEKIKKDMYIVVKKSTHEPEEKIAILLDCDII